MNLVYEKNLIKPVKIFFKIFYENNRKIVKINPCYINEIIFRVL